MGLFNGRKTVRCNYMRCDLSDEDYFYPADLLAACLEHEGLPVDFESAKQKGDKTIIPIKSGGSITFEDWAGLEVHVIIDSSYTKDQIKAAAERAERILIKENIPAMLPNGTQCFIF